MVKSKSAKPFTKFYYTKPTYYKIPAGYEHAIIKKGAKIGPEKFSELLSTNNKQGTCSQPQRLTGNPPKYNLMDNKYQGFLLV